MVDPRQGPDRFDADQFGRTPGGAGEFDVNRPSWAGMAPMNHVQQQGSGLSETYWRAEAAAEEAVGALWFGALDGGEVGVEHFGHGGEGFFAVFEAAGAEGKDAPVGEVGEQR